MSAKFKRYVLATLGSTVLMGLLALPAEAKPPADNPNAGQPLKPSDGAVINGRLDQIETTLDSITNSGDQCTACHNDTDLISSKHAQWSLTRHATGEAFLRGTSAGCSGCHSGGGFVARVTADPPQDPDEVTEGDPSPSRQDCRACHQIHVTYTTADWALETTAPVSLYAVTGTPVFNKGEGNLCASCHQPRREYPGDPDGDGIVTGISTHWGPHHGPQSGMMLGVAGSVSGEPGTHYKTNILADSCVSCHMGSNDMHNLDVDTSVCETCHGGEFDPSTYQDYIKGRLDVLGAKLVSLGVLSSYDESGHPTVTEADEPVAAALFNWLYIAHEDKSLGVHNPNYTEALLDAACTNVGCP